ncbi:hypothetical protein [Raineya sp.]
MILTTDNIQYAPASAIVAEVEALRKANAPESVIQVLIDILRERKEFLQKALQLTEASFGKVFQHNFRNSLIDNYKYYQSELSAINQVLT